MTVRQAQPLCVVAIACLPEVVRPEPNIERIEPGRRTAALRVRCHPDQLAALRRRAGELEIPMASLVRQALVTATGEPDPLPEQFRHRSAG